ncbi:MAG: hypothetical protein WD316_05350 [Phycisphaeraceae bacterium]
MSARPLAALTLALLTSLAAAGPGCVRTTVLGEHATNALAQRVYPDEADYGDDFDIIVERDGHTLTLINRTPRTIHGVELWLNRQYVRGVTSIAIGGDNHFDLRTFINRFGEAFPVAILLAPDRARPVVAAELYDSTAGTRHRLLVQPPPE